MSTMDDLRGTLDRHAAELTDHDVHVRPVAVRERIRVVRRRRRTAVGAVAASVVAAMAVTLTLPLAGDRKAPVADRTLAGHEAPRTMSSLGYTFTFAEGREGEGRVRLRLAPSDGPRLVSWATSGPDDEVTLRGVDEGPRTVTTEDFGDFVRVPPRRAGTVSVTGEGAVALAVYDLSGAAPGDTSDGITFRDDVAGQRLLADAIGEPGEADLGFDLSTDGGALPISYLCSGGPGDAWLHISVNGGGAVSGSGCDDPLFDPAGNGGITTYPDAEEARALRVRMWVTHGQHGDVVEDPDLRIAVAAYAPAPSAGRLAGWPVPLTREYGGHLWRLVDTKAGAPGTRELTVRGVDGQETLVEMSFARTGRAVVRTLEDGRPGESTFSAGGSGSTEAVIPATGGTAGLRAGGDGLRPDLELGLATYVRAD
ncbi:hypothetical protein GCM10009844_29760 [Nocardioides koreensis]|uniref:DUF4179 domain-containing protein n=1 Tax=Nocardioides koreensis TaxID=433651 RepID=A0ABP5LLQ3_9ACTN